MITLRVTNETVDTDGEVSSECIEMSTDQDWSPTVARDLRDAVWKLVCDRWATADELAEAELLDDEEYEADNE